MSRAAVLVVCFVALVLVVFFGYRTPERPVVVTEPVGAAVINQPGKPLPRPDVLESPAASPASSPSSSSVTPGEDQNKAPQSPVAAAVGASGTASGHTGGRAKRLLQLTGSPWNAPAPAPAAQTATALAGECEGRTSGFGCLGLALCGARQRRLLLSRAEKV